MSEIAADPDHAAASYWLQVAARGGPEKSAALAQAATRLHAARAEALPSPGSGRGLDIGLAKVIPLEQQRRPVIPRHRIGEAVAEVELRRVAVPFAIGGQSVGC